MKESIRVIFTILILLSCVGLPLLIPNLHGKLLIVLVIAWLLSKPNFQSIRAPLFILFSSLLLIAIIGVTYSDNTTYSIGYLETYSVLVFFPLIILSSASLIERKVMTKTL